VVAVELGIKPVSMVVAEVAAVVLITLAEQEFRAKDLGVGHQLPLVHTEVAVVEAD
jgi:hypothetical protein